MLAVADADAAVAVAVAVVAAAVAAVVVAAAAVFVAAGTDGVLVDEDVLRMHSPLVHWSLHREIRVESYFQAEKKGTLSSEDPNEQQLYRKYWNELVSFGIEIRVGFTVSWCPGKKDLMFCSID